MTSPETDPVESTEQSGPDFTIDATPQKPPRGRRLPGSRGGSAPKDSAPKSPRARRSTSDSRDPVDAPEYVPGRIAAGLKDFYGRVGLMAGMFDPMIGATCIENAEQMANSMERLAKESSRTRVFLDKLITSSAVGEAIAAHSPLMAAIGMRFIPGLRSKLGQMAPQPGGSGMNGQAETSGPQGPDNLRAV